MVGLAAHVGTVVINSSPVHKGYGVRLVAHAGTVGKNSSPVPKGYGGRLAAHAGTGSIKGDTALPRAQCDA